MAKPKTLKNFEPGRGFSEADWNEVSDNPEWTKEDVAKARPFAELFPALAAEIGRGRGPNKAPTKQLVSQRAVGLPETDASRDKDGRAPVSKVRRKGAARRVGTPAPKKSRA